MKDKLLRGFEIFSNIVIGLILLSLLFFFIGNLVAYAMEEKTFSILEMFGWVISFFQHLRLF